MGELFCYSRILLITVVELVGNKCLSIIMLGIKFPSLNSPYNETKWAVDIEEMAKESLQTPLWDSLMPEV